MSTISYCNRHENTAFYSSDQSFTTVPTHNKHLSVRPKKVRLLWKKCLFGEKCLFLEIILGGNDKEEIVTLELINEVEVTENEDHKLPKNLKFSAALHNFSKIIKKWVLSDSMLKNIYFSGILLFSK